MATLKIKGWESGFNKLRMTRILIDKLMLDEKQADELLRAVSAGQVISLDIEDGKLAEELLGELRGLGVLVEVES